ncbi:heme-dependent oxidative N-demethylase family protein [Aspergillus saccharolyticus JOP 1030-1]|uniref:HRQ family protein n=1 Tax=Aspergillus saccharolyticus JOP 1030-1 TaxID=1450539 RepID=A0A318ZQ47_9EURO|nr:HRQ family protein [Aspergillus saccharolyticus JOP 1030-1]PYH48745.1 HRQ family protein [Aspergillus saccharolyticus JOP 1030-1]
MDTILNQNNVWLLGLCMLALSGIYLVGERLRSYTRSNRRRTRQPSPSTNEKQAPTNSPPATYVDALPPQRRQSLASLPLPVAYKDIDEEEIKQHILSMTADYRTSPDRRYTPTGFSIGEIKALGEFPDYATLSGVPLPQAYREFDIDRALPRPYRPFRWAYHQTMSLTKMESDWWIELENTYRARIAQRQALYAQHGSNVLGSLPGSELACKELMEMVLQFVAARYPQYFQLQKLAGGKGHVFHNRILGTAQDVGSRHPLEILIENIPEDFGIMLRDERTGFYFLRAGVVCSSLGWNVGTKIGMQLHEIHEKIPDYKEKMQFSMDRFFTKMPTDKPIQRGSWGIEVGEPLYMPKGDPQETLRETQNPDLKLEDCNLRVDWQTLRRLPLSAAVVFNFKALFTPVTEFRDEPGVPALAATVLKQGKRNLMEYKGTWHVEHVVLPKLEKWAEEQVKRGLVAKGWEVATLEDSPWFRGWQEKWHRQQGF